MAGALRPAVLLMALASLLFLLAGWLDGVHPGGEQWSLDAYGGLGWTSYFFGFVNGAVAVLIARGSERILALRIGLAAFFMAERTVTGVSVGPKPPESVVVHLVTAVLEGVILVTTLRVYRLGRSIAQADLTLLSLPTAAAPLAATAADGAAAQLEPSLAVAVDAVPEPAAAPEVVREPATPRPSTAERVVPRISPRASWGIGLLTLLLAAALVADGAVAGIVPGVAVDVASADRLVYLFALVVLVVAARAVHGGGVALRLLLVVALINFVERAFTPFALRIADPTSLGLHLAGAFVALALALASAAALRSTARSRSRSAAPS